MNLLESVIEEFQRRQILFAGYLCPFFLSSFACHAFNILNAQEGILWQAGAKANTRLHLLMIAPTGAGKNLYLDHFLSKDYGILGGIVPSTFELSMTEAGFTGTIRKNKGGWETKYGMAWEYRRGIIGVEEFSAITRSLMAKPNSAPISLDAVLLSALDSGRVIKRLAGGKIEYKTDVTLWVGTQPARYEMSSGLGRRFCFIAVLPNARELFEIKMKRRAQMGVKLDLDSLQSIRSATVSFLDSLRNCESISFDESVYDMFDRLKIPHWDEILMERLLLGLHLVRRTKLKSSESVVADSLGEELVQKAIKFRRWASFGAERVLFLRVLKSLEPLYRKEFLIQMTHYGYDFAESQRILSYLIQRGFVKDKMGKLSTLLKVGM